MAWDVDNLPIGPGLLKRHGRLDVNWNAPTGPSPNWPPGGQIPAWTPGDAGKVLQVQTDGTLAWVFILPAVATYNTSAAYNESTYAYNES